MKLVLYNFIINTLLMRIYNTFLQYFFYKFQKYQLLFWPPDFKLKGSLISCKKPLIKLMLST